VLEERARILSTVLWCIGLVLVSGAFFLAYWLRDEVLPGLGLSATGLYPLFRYLPLLPLALVIWALLLLSIGFFRSHRTVPLAREAAEILRATGGAAALFLAGLFLLRLDELLLEGDKVSRLFIGIFFVLTFLLLLSFRVVVRLLSYRARARGLSYRTIVIVGTNPTAVRIAQSIEENPHWGYKILGFVVNGDGLVGPRIGPYPVLGRLHEIPDIVAREVVDEVIFSVDRKHLDQLEGLLLTLEELGVCARLALNLFPHTRAKLTITELDDVPLLTYSTAPNRQLQLVVKRCVDVAISLLLLILTLPLMAAIAVVILLASGRPIIYRQVRCGLNGRPFTLYKFRTMIRGAEKSVGELGHLNEMGGPVFKLKKDPRITHVGRYLRRFSLDELPQLWNVFKGDMSLVGPRPPIPTEVQEYHRWQRRRLSVTPGLTCLWQISGRNEIDFDRWMELDLQYIDSWSPMLDLEILAKTIPVVLTGRGAS
jgi:exopolysaccharide biosynthesis polyprenyl glycosylphosphotransferase